MTNYRYLERFDKLLLDLLANNPAMNTSTNPGNKRKGGDGDDSLNKSGDGTLTQTRSKNRTLFSKSMIGKHLLNPESDQLLEETSEEEILSGTGVGEESFGVSPVVVGDNCPRHFNRENQNNGDKIQVEKTTDDAEARDEVEVSTADNVSKDKDDNEQYELAESSVDNGFEADDTATIDIEINAADEEETEDDIFSDAFSVASVNNSKLPKGSMLDNSRDDSEDDEIFAKSQNPPKQEKPAQSKKGKSTKSQASKQAATKRSTSSSSTPSSHSSVYSTTTPQSTRRSQLTRTAAPPNAIVNTTTTPPTVKKKSTSAKTSANKNLEKLASKSKNTKGSKARLKNPTTSKNSTTPPTSRSGHTGANLAVETPSSMSSTGASANLDKDVKKSQERKSVSSIATPRTATAGRKSSNAKVSCCSTARSTTSSPQPKKKAGEGSAIKGYKTIKKNLTDSSNELLEPRPGGRDGSCF